MDGVQHTEYNYSNCGVNCRPFMDLVDPPRSNSLAACVASTCSVWAPTSACAFSGAPSRTQPHVLSSAIRRLVKLLSQSDFIALYTTARWSAISEVRRTSDVKTPIYPHHQGDMPEPLSNSTTSAFCPYGPCTLQAPPLHIPLLILLSVPPPP
ncbi:hypothetical protein Hypma_007007 [Hypsizygus marmoreus]|uniref:Uncharacterized protein n=1 Tax=Hypsizygus marmoreus TaxID=39966 RepID=A0A369KAI2_HYPMA|nr:hypothetical protein Hypma_007007 [Hypsizygus marmoreus]